MTGVSGKARTRMARRKVLFCHEVRVNVIQSVDMLSNQQIRKMWYSRDEMASMKMSAKAPLHQQDQQKEECDYGLQSSTESFADTTTTKGHFHTASRATRACVS